MNPLELAANATMTISIVLAARNSVHTWWIGIIACLLFAQLFAQARLYADVTLQAFFVLTSAWGWWQWRARPNAPQRPVGQADAATVLRLLALGVLGALAYGWLLHRWTDAFAPYLDSLVLAFSIVAQLLLMRRLVQTWWFWLLVNVLCVPLFLSRELYLTAALYAAYFVNALFGLRHWRALLQRQSRPEPSA